MLSLNRNRCSVGKRKEIKKLNQEETLAKKKAILTALAKASEDYVSSKDNPSNFSIEPDDYFTLSHDEIDALISGDMEKIEAWVSNMDRSHATSLLRWLIKEKW